MARRGRKKKNNITYDSKETVTFLGLVTFVLGIFFFISTTFSPADGDTTIFSQAKNIFGDATLVLSAFLIILALKMLGLKLEFIKPLNLITQFIEVVLLSSIFTAFSTVPKEVALLENIPTEGGYVGKYIIRNIFQDWLPTTDGTKIILILVFIVLLPIALTLSVSKVVEFIKKIVNAIKNLVVYLFVYKDESDSDIDTTEDLPKAARFGDFNNLINRENHNEAANVRPEPKFSEDNTSSHKDIKRAKEMDGIEYKEGEIGEEGLKQDRLKYPDWKLPPLTLLKEFKTTQPKEAAIKQNANIIEQILESFNIEAKVEDAYIGPSVIQYALNIPLGIKVSKVSTLAENIALALGVDSKAVRIDTIPETTYLGIEVPRSSRDMVRIRELMSSDIMQSSDMELPVPVGKDIHGESVIANIYKMPHLLIAGATGSGKSILTNTFITSLIMKKTPDELKLILVDPKQVELIDYNGIPHLLTPVITDMDKVVNALKWAVSEMERRYTTLANEQVRNIDAYNKKKGFAAMPYIVIVIDEMADMMMTSNRVESENNIVRLAQKARAVGIHLILATQRPSVNVITGIIKANIPGRIGMSVTSSTDSRVILDRIGAESLMGSGDLLYKAPDKTKSNRLQGAFVEQNEVISVVNYIKSQAPEVEYITEITEKHLSGDEETQEVLGDISEDNLVEQAIRIVVRAGKGSSSYLQRRLNIGFNRAARLLEELEEAGVVGPPNGSKPREVLISDADSFIEQLKGGV